MEEVEFGQKEAGKVTMVTASLHNQFISTYKAFIPFPHSYLSPFPYAGWVWSSSSVADDLHGDTLLLTDSRITARRVMQDERQRWQLTDRVCCRETLLMGIIFAWVGGCVC